MKIQLESLLDGAAIERFNHELGRVVADIRDPNTAPKAARAVTMKLTIKPMGEDREAVLFELSVASKLGGLRKVVGTAVVDDAGMYGADPRQQNLELDSTVTPIREGTTDA